ncbi:uncharacterized protein LOC62_02G002539 [Vanrija pseudolonga]|uniref:Uncharacterized protein n=1 Tax=Vanrija pseudolonga TaxID=143232 RepID=A0AAF0Y2P8_9TREE|nr:hypothetical protein LOC62_02G002539 [Vanrija pseudolonga]
MATHRAAVARHVYQLVLARRELVAPQAAFRQHSTSATGTFWENNNPKASHHNVLPVSEGHIRGAPSPLGFLPSSKPPSPKLDVHLPSPPAPDLSEAPSLPDLDNLSPAELAERLRALSPSAQFAVALAAPPARTVGRVPHLLALPLGDTVAEKHVRLAELRDLINYLTSVVDEDETITTSFGKQRRNRRRSLLLVWGAWFDLARHLHSLAALPRLGGPEGRELRSEWFESLLLILKNTQDSQRHTDDAERAAANMESRYGFSRPTMRSVLQFMVDIGCRPTYFQLQLLLQSTPMSVVMHEAKAAQSAPDLSPDHRLGALASLVAPLTPESFAGLAALSEAHRNPKHERQQLRHLYLEAGHQSLSIIEEGERRGLAPPPQWYAVVNERRPEWTAFVSRYVQQAAAVANGTSDTPLALPAKSESYTLWLLLRDLLIHPNRDVDAGKHRTTIPAAAPPGNLQAGATTSDQSTLPFDPFDLTDTLDLIRLSCGVMSEKTDQATARRPAHDKRINSCIIRSLLVATHDNWDAIDRISSFMLRSVRQEDVLSPGHSTAITVPIPPTPIRTISFLLGTCKTPNQLQRMLPRVEGLAVLPGGHVSPIVRERAIALASLADRFKSEPTVPATKRNKHDLEGRVQALFKRLDKLGGAEAPAPPQSY